MRSPFMVVLLGLASGALGAALMGRLSGSHETARAPARVQRAAAQDPVITPPGWDPRFLSRLPPPAAPPAAPAPAAPAAEHAVADKEREREQHYRDELEHRESELANHDAEALDHAWADSEGATVRDALSSVGNGVYTVKSVDCRSKTCVAELTYPSPAQAVARHAVIGNAAPAGCHGMFSALTPPTSDGLYDTTVIYYCR
jgi:hypothetical protein